MTAAAFREVLSALRPFVVGESTFGDLERAKAVFAKYEATSSSRADEVARERLHREMLESAMRFTFKGRGGYVAVEFRAEHDAEWWVVDQEGDLVHEDGFPEDDRDVAWRFARMLADGSSVQAALDDGRRGAPLVTPGSDVGPMPETREVEGFGGARVVAPAVFGAGGTPVSDMPGGAFDAVRVMHEGGANPLSLNGAQTSALRSPAGGNLSESEAQRVVFEGFVLPRRRHEVVGFEVTARALPKLGQLVSSDEAVRTPRQHDKPCPDCPFARAALPGWLGG